MGFGSYLASILGIGAVGYPIAFGIMLIFVLSIINIFGIRKAAKADFYLVAVKIAILLIFVAFAVLVAISIKDTRSSIFPAIEPSNKRVGPVIRCKHSHILRIFRIPDNKHIHEQGSGGASGRHKGDN